MTQRFIAICGPTASGKSALSINLAQNLGGEILSFDASQTFNQANIGTAKLSPEDQDLVPHHLIDIFSPAEKVEAGLFVTKAELAYSDIVERKKVPLLCVGTTMYLSVFLEGLAKTGVRNEHLRKELEAKDNTTLHDLLVQVDPVRAKALHPNDKLRVIRALEIAQTSGSVASTLYAKQERKLKYQGLLIVLCWDRARLALRIQKRVASMIGQGLVEESRDLLEKFGSHAQIFDSIGYAESLAYLEGKLSLAELVDLVATHTRQLAKKQMTFWRRFPIKHKLLCEPIQEFPKFSARTPKSERVHDFTAAQLTLPELLQHCRSAIEQPLEAPSKVLYVEAEPLLRGLAVT